MYKYLSLMLLFSFYSWQELIFLRFLDCDFLHCTLSKKNIKITFSLSARVLIHFLWVFHRNFSYICVHIPCPEIESSHMRSHLEYIIHGPNINKSFFTYNDLFMCAWIEYTFENKPRLLCFEQIMHIRRKLRSLFMSFPHWSYRISD